MINYTSAEQRPDRLAIAFLLASSPDTPDGSNAVQTAALSLLEERSAREQWVITRFHATSVAVHHRSAAPLHIFGQSIDGDQPSASAASASGPSPFAFSNQSTVLRDQCGKQVPAGNPPELERVLQSLLDSPPPPLASRHVVILAGSGAVLSNSSVSTLVNALTATSFQVHAVASTPQPALEALCGATEGFYRQVDSDGAIAAELQVLHAALGSHYTVRFPWPPHCDRASSKISVQVFTASESGEADFQPKPSAPPPPEAVK